MANHDALDCEFVYGNNKQCDGQNDAVSVTLDGKRLMLRCNKCGEKSFVSWTYQEYREIKNKKNIADHTVIRKRKKP